MTEKKPIVYRGEFASRAELLNRLFQLGRLGQTQGEDIDWELLEDEILGSEPHKWLDEEMTEVEDLIKDDE